MDERGAIRRVDELARKAEILRANEIAKDDVCGLQSRHVGAWESDSEVQSSSRPVVQRQFLQVPRSTSQSRSQPTIVASPVTSEPVYHPLRPSLKKECQIHCNTRTKHTTVIAHHDASVRLKPSEQ